MLPIAHLWLLAVIPIGFAIIPISELTIVLLLVLAADVAVGFLLGEDLQLKNRPSSGDSAGRSERRH